MLLTYGVMYYSVLTGGEQKLQPQVQHRETRRQPQARAVAIPLLFPPDYDQNLISRLAPSKIKKSARDMTDGEVRAFTVGAEIATIINTVGWSLFIAFH